jgi:hypothetical protein
MSSSCDASVSQESGSPKTPSLSPNTPSLSPIAVKRKDSPKKVEPRKRKCNPRLSFLLVAQRVLKLNFVCRAFRNRLLWIQAYREWSLATPTCLYSLTGDTASDFYNVLKAQMRERNKKIVADWRWVYEQPARMAKFYALQASMRK